MSKYGSLTRHLKSARAGKLPMHFGEIEAILGFPLPGSARKHRPWWSNEAEGSHVQARAWANAGYHVAEVDLQAERLVFIRLHATGPEVKGGDHPLWGAMKGTITYRDDLDLTEPAYTDDELDRSVADLARLVAEGRN